MEEVLEDKSTNNALGCKKKNVTRLQRSFLHLSRAFGKLHGRRRYGHANPSSTSLSSLSSSAATSSFLSGCMHPRTHSFASGRRRRHHHNHDDDGDGGGGDDDAALAVNFRSLRVDDGGGPSSSAQDHCYGGDGGRSEEEAADDDDEPSNSKAAAVVRGGVAVATLSAAPYEDFRRSMREMVDFAAAAAEGSESAVAAVVDWDFMEELLFCYLRLNDRAVHKDILRAFTDTVAAIRRRAAAAKSTRALRRRRRRQRRRRQPSAGGEARRGDCDGHGPEAVMTTTTSS